MKFWNRDGIVEALRYDGQNTEEIVRWAHDGCHPYMQSIIFPEWKSLTVRDGHDYKTAYVGDWIIKDRSGKFSPINNGLFELDYEEVG